jgi:hypothetical protein
MGYGQGQGQKKNDIHHIPDILSIEKDSWDKDIIIQVKKTE